MIIDNKIFLIVACILVLACTSFPSASATDLAAEIDSAVSEQRFSTARALLDEHLVEHPDDSDAHFKRAQVLGWAGNYAAALDEYDKLAGQYPDNVDYSLGRAQVLAGQGNDVEAMLELERAREMSPKYEAIWQLQYRLLSKQENETAKAKLDTLRLEAEQQFPQAAWLDKPDHKNNSRWTILAGLTIEQLTNDLPGWNQQFLEIALDRDNSARYFFRTIRHERFDRSDSALGAGADWQLPRDWFAGANLSVAPDAEFQPEYEYGVHLGHKLMQDWVLDLQHRRRHYDTVIVDSYIGIAEYYFDNFRVAYALGLSHLHGASNSVGHSVTLNWYRNDHMSFGISYHTGDEAEAIGAGRVLITSVRGITLTGRLAVNHRIGLNWWLGTHEQGDFYRRQYAGLAVSVGL